MVIPGVTLVGSKRVLVPCFSKFDQAVGLIGVNALNIKLERIAGSDLVSFHVTREFIFDAPQIGLWASLRVTRGEIMPCPYIRVLGASNQGQRSEGGRQYCACQYA